MRKGTRNSTMHLSYSSLNNLHNGHEWINKQMGIPVPGYPFLKDGLDAHRAIQDHVSGKKKNDLLKHIDVVFPIVEETAFDKRCKFSFNIKGYDIIGFTDGRDPDNKRLLEIKTSTNGWSIRQFKNAIQRKLYALALQKYEEFYLITGTGDMSQWDKKPPKVYSLTISTQDRIDAQDWILQGINKLESGDFTGGLNEEGRCTGCFWNHPKYPEMANCNFL